MRLLVLSILFLFASSDPFGYEDEDCVGVVNEQSFEGVSTEALSLAMNRGLWKCAKEIARLASESRIDVRSIFDLETRTINKEISLLKGVIESNLPMSTISPAFQWAQSVNDVFLNIKFAHKLDAPATLNVEAQNVTLDAQSLALRASDGRKLFVLDIELLKEIVPEESSWSMASVGRMTITLKKKDSPTKWARLTKGRKKPNNIHFWFEIHEKYSSELEKLKDDDNEEEEPPSPPPPPPPPNTEKEKENEKPGKGKKKTKKEKRGEKIEDEKEIAAKEWLKTQLSELENRVKEKKQEVDDECRSRKKLIESNAEKEKEEIRREYSEKIRKDESHTPAAGIGPDLGPGQEEL